VYPFNAMTGEQVVGKLLKVPVTHLDYIERDMTHSYVNGIKDGTQGSTWCFTGAILPHELNIELAGAIKEARRLDELKGNAAPLLLDELRRRYPCNSNRGGKS
jgi:hypothetical protein